MPKYIDTDKLKITVNYWLMQDDNALLIPLRNVYESIDNAPTADVRENVHAHWIHERLVSTGGGSYPVVRCSACQWQYPMSETRFCPNCGAVMDGKERK